MIERILFLGGPNNKEFRTIDTVDGCNCIVLVAPSEIKHIMNPPENLKDLDPVIKTTRYYRSQINPFTLEYGVDAIFRC